MFTTLQTTELQAKLFRGFADPARLAILFALQSGSMTVSDLMVATNRSQSNTSNHLSCLKECGLVAREQRGKFVYYRLSDPRVSVLLGIAQELVVEVAKGIYDCVRYTPLKESEQEYE